LGGPATITKSEIIGDDGDEAFAWRVNDAGGSYACGVTTVAHCHGERLFAVTADFLEERIEVKGDAREVAEVFH